MLGKPQYKNNAQTPKQSTRARSTKLQAFQSLCQTAHLAMSEQLHAELGEARTLMLTGDPHYGK